MTAIMMPPPKERMTHLVSKRIGSSVVDTYYASEVLASNYQRKCYFPSVLAAHP